MLKPDAMVSVTAWRFWPSGMWHHVTCLPCGSKCTQYVPAKVNTNLSDYTVSHPRRLT
jgi:hypothetical protein